MSKAPFEISVLPLGAGNLALCRMPGSVTELSADLQALVDIGASLVLTLTPLDELVASGAGALPQDLAAQGISWRHLPIGDFGTPEPSQVNDWDALSRDLHARLDRGETVAIHCRAGLGRTGMIALRLMTERGEGPDTALTRLRGTRPGSVERTAQFEWATQGRAMRGPYGCA